MENLMNEITEILEVEISADDSYTDNKEEYLNLHKMKSKTINALSNISTSWGCKEPQEGKEEEWNTLNEAFGKLSEKAQEVKKILKDQINEATGNLSDDTANINIYIADLNAYNNGYLKGEWVSLPQDEEVLEMVMDKYSNFGQTDIAIHDYECDFMKISEYDNISNLNTIAEEMDGLDETEIKVFKAYLDYYGSDYIDEALQTVRSGDYSIYYDCSDMSDVAEQYIEETGLLSTIPDSLQYYFDYEAYGRDMEINGTFTSIDGDIIEFY